MPELPEVQTIINDLRKVIPGLKISDFWTDIDSFKKIKKEILGEKILNINRYGKNILIGLSGGKTLLIHQKLTGHLLYGKWENKNSEWVSEIKGPLLDDAKNKFLHLIIFFNNNMQLALSDLRKFAKVILLKTENLYNFSDITNLGPDPIEKSFIFPEFQKIITHRKGKIKLVLMDQKVISGIGNIYSDEILWEAGVHPLSKVENLKKDNFKKIFLAMKKILIEAIKNKGDSMSDYRRPSGEKGNYQEMQNAYQMTNRRCKKNDKGIIRRIKIGGRSAHFCPVHQILY